MKLIREVRSGIYDRADSGRNGIAASNQNVSGSDPTCLLGSIVQTRYLMYQVISTFPVNFHVMVVSF